MTREACGHVPDDTRREEKLPIAGRKSIENFLVQVLRDPTMAERETGAIVARRA